MAAAASQAMALPRRPLGNTGLQVSVLGFGASPLGSVFKTIDEAEGVRSVHAAFAAGINFFDTSPFYGATRSEAVLGRALRDLPRSQFVLSTKVGRYGQDTFDFSAKRVTASVAESLERLQVPYIDVLLCHDIEFGDVDQIVNETLPALAALRAQGLIKHVGFSCLPLPLFPRVLERVQPGTVDVVLSYCHNSLNDSSLVPLLPQLSSHGVGVVSASPLSMGLLTPQGPPSWHPAPQEVQDACASAAAHASGRGVDISRLALAHAVREPGIATNLVGMASCAEVAANVEVTLQALGVVPNPQEEVEASVTKEVKQLLAPIQGVSWASGRPENN